jgi:hypothetical protein
MAASMLDVQTAEEILSSVMRNYRDKCVPPGEQVNTVQVIAAIGVLLSDHLTDVYQAIDNAAD